MREMLPKNRTEKKFKDYNDYHDRGMVKWLMAYAMDELVKSDSSNRTEAMKSFPVLPQMDLYEIEEILNEASKKNKAVSVQLNFRDSFGRQTESKVGRLAGTMPGEILIEDEWIMVDDIRNVQIVYDEKWFNVELFQEQAKATDGLAEEPESSGTFNEETEITYVKIDWIEDFNQDQEWME